MPTKIDQKLINNIQPKNKEYDIRDTELKGYLIRVQPSGNASYVFSYKNKTGNNKRYKIANTNEIKATQARQIVSQLKLKVANGVDVAEERKNIKKISEQQSERTLSAFLKSRYEGFVKSHHDDAKGSLSRLKRLEALWGEIPLESFDLKMIYAHRENRIKNGISHSTINRDMNCIRRLFTLAVEEGTISTSPFEKLKPLKTDKNPITRFLDDGEEKRLIRALESREAKKKKSRNQGNDWRLERGYEKRLDISEYEYSDYLLPMVLIALKTGLRRSELFKLKWADVDLEAPNPRLNVLGSTTKSSQSRIVPLNEEGKQILLEWKRLRKNHPVSSDLVFPNSNTGEQRTEIGSAWDKVLISAEIEAFRFHDLRHTFASKLAMKGTALNTIRELMGHSEISTTLRYAHLAPKYLEDAVEGI